MLQTIFKQQQQQQQQLLFFTQHIFVICGLGVTLRKAKIHTRMIIFMLFEILEDERSVMWNTVLMSGKDFFSPKEITPNQTSFKQI